MATDHYFEFDLNEKLRGDLESRFPAHHRRGRCARG